MQIIRPFFRFLRPTTLTACAAVAITACDDTLSPRDLSGLYVLETVGGSQLPAVFRQFADGTGTTYTTTIFADTLTFFENGRGTLGGARYIVLVQRNGENEERVETTGRYGLSYEIRDGVIYFQPDPPSFPLHSLSTVGESRMLISPPDEPSFLSYIQRKFEATLGESGLAVDEVSMEGGATLLAPPQTYRRVY